MTSARLDRLVASLSSGDMKAAEPLYLEFEPYLRMVVRRNLPRRLRAKLDSADVVQSVWAKLISGLQASEWDFGNAAQLRAFLVKATRNRLIDRVRQHRRALEHEQPLTETRHANMPRSREPRASEVAQADDLWQQMLVLCPPEHHELLRLKGQGLPLADVAARTGMHVDSVRRVIRQLARQMAVAPRFGRPARTVASGPCERSSAAVEA
jgi:RNA polymerase sigma factor (sigma-70 family)